jgi:hypothetical protein
MTLTMEVHNERANPASTSNDDGFDSPAVEATVFVYGYGPMKNPFYEQARAINTTPQGALLTCGSPVSRGQKLLLLNGTGSDPVEAEVVRARTLDAQMFEAEVVFTVPQQAFWAPFRRTRKTDLGREKRRSPRVNLPRGMTVSWNSEYRRDISRVSSLSAGGMFIEADDPAPVGQALQVQFDLPNGPVLGKAVVRRSTRGKGMGVEFTELSEEQRTALSDLMQRLLGGQRDRK